LPDQQPVSLLELKAPETEEEWAQMYQLRWSILRQPWGQPAGSERDELEETACHRIALADNTGIIGTGRLHQVDRQTAQIRYMAVPEAYRGMGIGTKILHSLEEYARLSGFTIIRLDARETALPFYQSQGYEPIRKSHLLFDVIQHVEMQKML